MSPHPPPPRCLQRCQPLRPANVHTIIPTAATLVTSTANKVGNDSFTAKEVFCQAVPHAQLVTTSCAPWSTSRTDHAAPVHAGGERPVALMDHNMLIPGTINKAMDLIMDSHQEGQHQHQGHLWRGAPSVACGPWCVHYCRQPVLLPVCRSLSSTRIMSCLAARALGTQQRTTSATTATVSS